MGALNRWPERDARGALVRNGGRVNSDQLGMVQLRDETAETAAAITVASNAESADDLRVLLQALGLLTPPGPDEPTPAALAAQQLHDRPAEADSERGNA